MIIEPEIWMISLLNDKRATEFRNEVLLLWEKQGFKVNLFSAITPDMIPMITSQLNFSKKYLKVNKGASVPFTETEKAVFYSHYMLWRKSYEDNKSLMILEEDAIPIKIIPKIWNIERISLLGMPIATGYIITPIKGKALSEDIQKRIIKDPVDGFLYSHTFLKNSKEKYIIPSDDQKVVYIKQQKRNWSSIKHLKL
jgi:GR25 family glycosyltransferase involved in LPS biosynthesis